MDYICVIVNKELNRMSKEIKETSTAQQRMKRSTLKRAKRLIVEVNMERRMEGVEALSMPEFLDSALEYFEDERKKHIRGDK